MNKQLQNNLVLIILVIAAAASLSLLAYQFSNQTVDRINSVSVSGIRTNTEIQATDLSNSLSNKLGDFTGTLRLLSHAPAITEANLTRASILLDQAQNSSSGLVDFYLWLDQSGKIVWISSINQTTYNQYNGFDLSYRLYFTTPQQTHHVYYSSVTDSNDRINRLYISYPILYSNAHTDPANVEAFHGIIAAGIRIDVLGRFLEGQLAPGLQSEVVVLDNTGIVLYANHHEYEGKNVFGIRYQSFLESMSADTLEKINSGLTNALHGKSGSTDIALDSGGSKGTFVYKPILLDQGQFGVLYVIAPHTSASDVTSLLGQQSALFLAIFLATGGIAGGVLFLILTWNKRLAKVVKDRTSELAESYHSLQNANEQLKVHERLQAEFINVAAHELRTPVQPLLSAAELLDSKFAGNESIQVSKRDIDLILRNARRLERLASDILQVSRIDSGALKLDYQNFDLSASIKEAIRDATSQARFDSEKLRISYSGDSIMVHADKEKIIEVLSNLLSNSIKFTRKGTISITAQKDTAAGLAVVNVIDSGEGIDPDVQSKLFEKFVTKSDKGTGIGLYISKKIIEAHGGTITGQNRWDGSGASFTFTIPLAKD